MSDFVPVAKTHEIPDPGTQLVEVDERLVVLIHAAGHFYARRLTDAMGLDPTRVLRLSFTHTTAAWEVRAWEIWKGSWERRTGSRR